MLGDVPESLGVVVHLGGDVSCLVEESLRAGGVSPSLESDNGCVVSVVLLVVESVNKAYVMHFSELQHFLHGVGDKGLVVAKLDALDEDGKCLKHGSFSLW